MYFGNTRPSAFIVFTLSSQAHPASAKNQLYHLFGSHFVFCLKIWPFICGNTFWQVLCSHLYLFFFWTFSYSGHVFKLLLRKSFWVSDYGGKVPLYVAPQYNAEWAKLWKRFDNDQSRRGAQELGNYKYRLVSLWFNTAPYVRV